MKRDMLLPFNLQFFAEGDDPPEPAPPVTEPIPTPTQQIDYEKISQILAGKQAATEESVLKGYFKQQGLSKEEMESAISSFKEKKAKSQPNVEQLQNDVESARKEVLAERIKNEAFMMASDVGVELKNIIPVLKLAELSDVADKDGKVDKEKLKSAIHKVLEEIPVFKTVNVLNYKQAQYVRSTTGGYRPNQITDERAYLNQKYKDNPYYKGNIGGN